MDSPNPHPELERLRQAQIRRRNLMANPRHLDIMKAIDGKDPKYAKHMFLKNSIIEKFAKHVGGGVEILEQPVCIHCEKPAAWNEGGTAYCFYCHGTTPADKVVTVQQYLMDQLKGFNEEALERLALLGGEYNEIT